MTRLASGGIVDRQSPIRFRFDGRLYSGFVGDSLASALLANGVQLVGRSFKYHRPRGILTAALDEPNALVTVGRGPEAEPNCRATRVALHEGLEAFSQNCWPSPSFDLMAINRLFAPILVAGFYYKSFMWPSALWERIYEPLIRRAAGLGALSGAPDPASYDAAHAFADLLIVGSGPAGLAAARAAAASGARVIIVEDDTVPGGRLLAERHSIDGIEGRLWTSRVLDSLSAASNVRLMTRTSLFGAYDGNVFGAVERVDEDSRGQEKRPRQRYWKIAAQRSIIATGAVERPIVFGGNDRPGVMMASALQAYVNRFAVAPGRRAAIFTSGDSGHAAAADLAAAGIEVAAIIDTRVGQSAPTGIPVLHGEVIATHGKRLKGIDVRLADGRTRRVEVDLLGVSGGWNPLVGVASHIGARPVWDGEIHAFRAGEPGAGIRFAGAAAGAFSLGAALASGHAAACAALGLDLPFPEEEAGIVDPAGVSAPHIVADCRQKSFVDFQHDVTVDDVQLAAREGYRSVEHLKRYTTLGMATDQGKATQLLGHAVLAAERGCGIAEVGTIAARPPEVPVAIGALANFRRGPHLKPKRFSATQQWAVEQGATFVDAALWQRPQWFTRPGDADWLESAVREARTVRSAVGLCDVSTLGKIELAGPGAAELLDRLYANMMSSLPVGKCRYGLMLREDGFVFDDGTVARLGEDRFVVTTTTVNAGSVMRHIDHAMQVLWPELAAHAVSVTEQWTQIAIAGPASRALLTALLPDADLSNEALPFMGLTILRWDGVPLRLFRLSFSGELAYEVAVPASHGDRLIRRLSQLGTRFGAAPYGLEALSILRIEKGHVAGGELNGQVSAHDLGLGRLLSRKKDFIGRALAERAALADPARETLVGLRALDPAQRFSAGSHLFATGARVDAAHDQGHVTSVAYSPIAGGWIGLGLLARGAERLGQRIVAASPVRGTRIEVEVVSPIFYDPAGEKLRD